MRSDALAFPKSRVGMKEMTRNRTTGLAAIGKLCCVAAIVIGLSAVELMAVAVSVMPDTYEFLDGSPVSTMSDDAGLLINLGLAQTAYSSVTGAGYSVAILDTGVDSTHPALLGRYVGGWDYVDGDNKPQDDNGHGTHVTGISVSSDGTYGGIAPEAGYAALKVMDAAGHGTFGQLELGLQWVIANRAAHNIVALNMSLGTDEIYNTSQTSQISNELSTLKDAGVFIAVSSGNGWFDHSPTEGVASPAADPSAVAVGDVWTGNFGRVDWTGGATDYTTAADRIVSHCDRSTTMLDIFAPGARITNAAYDWEDDNNYFTTKSGTSMASPAVAGLAILIREAIEENWDPILWPEDEDWQDTILQIMQDTGVSIHDGDDENDNVANLDADFSRIDVLAALDYVFSMSSTAVPEPTTLALAVLGLLSLLFRGRRRRR